MGNLANWAEGSHIILIIFTTGLVPSAPSPPPSIVSLPKTVSLARGERAVLECAVRHLGEGRQLVWRRGFDVLATGKTKLSPDPRISVHQKGGVSRLEISSLRDSDAGEYVCQLSLLTGLLSLQHTLDVLVRASVRALEASVTVKEGEEARLECEVQGNPNPTVSWKKQDGVLPSTASPTCAHSSCLSLTEVRRDQAGVYVCQANNGVGAPAHGRVALSVLFPPTIRVEREQVVSGPGSSLSLACLVEGNPQPLLQWYFADAKVRPSHLLGISLGRLEGKHTLTITKTSVDTFGNYSCVAKNSLGTFKKHIEVHGRPTEATFERAGSKSGPRSFQLSWKVQSFAPIHEYRLLYRSLVLMESQMQAASSDWTNVIIPGSDTFVPGEQHVRWRLDNLGEDTNYECLVQARNEFGWSQPSKMFTFTTSQKNFQSPATQGLNWAGPASSSSKPFLGSTVWFPSLLFALASMLPSPTR